MKGVGVRVWVESPGFRVLCVRPTPHQPSRKDQTVDFQITDSLYNGSFWLELRVLGFRVNGL